MIIQLISIIVPILAITYLIIKPVQKDKEQNLTSYRKVKVGDEVVLISGLHGVVDSVDSAKNIITIDCEGVFFEYDLYAIKRVIPKEIEERA